MLSSVAAENPQLTSEFVFPDWEAPLDVDSYIDAVPAGAKITGAFFHGLVEHARAAGIDPSQFQRYSRLRFYPLVELLRLEIDLARQLFPSDTLRRAFRKLGGLVYERVQTHPAGKLALKLAGNDLRRFVRLVPALYRGGNSVERLSIISADDRSVVLRLNPAYNFPDAIAVGMFESGFQATGIDGEVRMHVRNCFDLDLLLTIKPPKD